MHVIEEYQKHLSQWRVYGLDYTNGALLTVSLRGGPVTTLADGLSSPVGPSIDSDSVYWGMTLTGTYSDNWLFA